MSEMKGPVKVRKKIQKKTEKANKTKCQDYELYVILEKYPLPFFPFSYSQILS